MRADVEFLQFLKEEIGSGYKKLTPTKCILKVLNNLLHSPKSLKYLLRINVPDMVHSRAIFGLLLFGM